jgi:hypothetical protein
MHSKGTRKRISRIMRRADPSVREAYQNGQLSARKADQLLYLEPESVVGNMRLEGVAEAAQIARYSPHNSFIGVTSLKSGTVSLIDPSFRSHRSCRGLRSARRFRRDEGDSRFLTSLN